MSDNDFLVCRALEIIDKVGIDSDSITLEVIDYPGHSDFWAGANVNHRYIVLSPRLAKESDKWLTNILTHELGHILAGHTEDKGPKTACQVVPFEAEANKYAIELFSKLYPSNEFYYNHLDTERMDTAKEYYTLQD